MFAVALDADSLELLKAKHKGLLYFEGELLRKEKVNNISADADFPREFISSQQSETDWQTGNLVTSNRSLVLWLVAIVFILMFLSLLILENITTPRSRSSTPIIPHL